MKEHCFLFFGGGGFASTASIPSVSHYVHRCSDPHIWPLFKKRFFPLFGIRKDILPSSASPRCHIWTLIAQLKLSSVWVAPPRISTNPTNCWWHLHIFAPPLLDAHPECRFCPQVTGVRKENEASRAWGYREIQDTWGHQVSPEHAWGSSYATVFLL